MTDPADDSNRGHCLCGAVRFELTAPPREAGYCHCTRCQRRTGTAVSAQVIIHTSDFHLLAGESAVRTWVPPTGNAKQFCGECGAHMFSRSPDGTWTAVRMSAFETDPGVRPSFRQFTDYAATWEPIPEDGLPRYPEGRPR